MKKSLLLLAAGLLSMGASAQTYSPVWPPQNSNFSIPSAGIRYMSVVNANVVWAIGYNGATPSQNFVEFTRTTNAGATYTSGAIFPDTITYHPASIEGISATTAWVTSYKNATGDKGAIHTTTNGGVTWTNMTPSFMYTVAGTSFADFTCFLTPTVGITLGDPAPTNKFEIYRTTNGGTTWTLVPTAGIPNANTGEYGLTDVFTKLGANDVWFGTNKGRIYHSNNAGVTWTVGATGATADVTSIAFRDANNGICYAYTGTTFGAYKTTNGGSTWAAISPLDPNMGQNDICAIPGTNWYASVGAASTNTVISYSTNDGSNWTSWGGANVQYLKIAFASNTAGYAGGFSDPMTASINGMFNFTGAPLGVTSIGAPVATTIDMYPNPSNGLVTINLLSAKEGAVITVIDAMGKVVYSENVRNISMEKHTLNLEHLAKGIYSVNITKAGEVATQKIIIQ